MKFTRDICRLLGLGGDLPGEEQMEAQDGASDPTDRRRDPEDPSQTMLISEEGLDEEERSRRRAERRRKKRKRQKQRRRLEREERMEDASEQEEEVAGAVSESDSEEELKDEEEEEEEQQWTAVRHRNRFTAEFVSTSVTEDRRLRPRPHRTSDEEAEWDVSSAFVAKAASHIKLKTLRRRATQNKENEARSSRVESTEEMKRRAEFLTAQGIRMIENGHLSQAVDKFTQAIHCDPKDHRFYGNRSYCYWFLEQYSPALRDAMRSIQLAPDWPMGYFRKGSALMGLKQYSEAEEALEQVLRFDPGCKEASSKLRTCRVQRLTEMGFDEEQSKMLLEKFSTVQAVIDSPEAKTLNHRPGPQDHRGSCRSLWVGNITLDVTEKDLRDLFKMYGEIESIRILHERFCAFVNFENANMAARALEKLQGAELGSSRLVMRYPDRRSQRALPPTQRTNAGLNAAAAPQGSAAAGSRRCVPVDGEVCYYWQTTGCFYGDKCLFKHTRDQQGRGRKPWQP